jgi:hypothetical protein
MGAALCGADGSRAASSSARALRAAPDGPQLPQASHLSLRACSSTSTGRKAASGGTVAEAEPIVSSDGLMNDIALSLGGRSKSGELPTSAREPCSVLEPCHSFPSLCTSACIFAAVGFDLGPISLCIAGPRLPAFLRASPKACLAALLGNNAAPTSGHRTELPLGDSFAKSWPQCAAGGPRGSSLPSPLSQRRPSGDSGRAGIPALRAFHLLPFTSLQKGNSSAPFRILQRGVCLPQAPIPFICLAAELCPTFRCDGSAGRAGRLHPRRVL